MLESPAIQPLRERITHTIEIPAFNEEQTAEYIKHRMAVSGFTGASPFQPKDIKKIYKLSHGIPARINELAHLHLSGETAVAIEPEQLPEEYAQLSFSKKRLVAGIAVITLVLVTLVFQDKINSLFEEPEKITTAAKHKPEATRPPVQTDEAGSEQKTIELDVNPITRGDSEQVPPATVATNETSTPTAAAETTPVQPDKTTATPEEPETPAVTSRIRSILPAPVTGSRQQQTILLNGEGFSKDTRVTVSWSGNRKQLSPEQVIYENTNQLRIQITVGSQADDWTVQTEDPVHGQSNLYAFRVTAAPATGLQTISWINRQNPEHFTLQLLGTYNKGSLESFVKRHQLEKNTAFFVSRRNNRNWYTLVHGRFASKPLAQQAVNQLPADLQKIRPWIRRFADIQSTTRLSAQPAPAKTGGDLVEPSKPALSAPANTPSSLDLTANAAWLWSQNPGHYTLQLLGSHQLEALRSFIKQHQLARQTSFYRTRRNNREWFVLLYGSYPDREQALAAISRLPAELQRSKPWARRFADIHAELSSQ
jgi:DamX protein